MLRLFPLLLLLVACVGNAGAARIPALLSGRTVIFGPDGATRDDSFWQSWTADGRTETGGPGLFAAKSGRWQVQDGRYCEIFGLSTEWTCWRITLSDGDRQIRFWEIPGDVGDLVFLHKDMEGYFAP
ncbi:hypothetical protein MASR2M74_32970 [Paracoccaceae bacterium]